MKYSNKHLIEVNCGFQFLEETTPWDSTFFGQYYEKIKELGFNHREERKGVQITFNPLNIEQINSPITTSKIEDQVVFRNNEKGLAVVLGKGKISFHTVQGYAGWESFLNDFIKPYFEFYKALGLGNGKRQSSVVYLNRFVKNTSDNLSDYLTIISPFKKDFGIEVVSTIQRVVSNNDNFLIAKLNSQVVNSTQVNINLECGAVCTNDEYMNSDDWEKQANITHAPIFEFFENIITNTLKKEL